MKLKYDITNERHPETINTLLAFRKHQDVNKLVRECMILLDESNYTNMINRTSNSPYKKDRKDSQVSNTQNYLINI